MLLFIELALGLLVEGLSFIFLRCVASLARCTAGRRGSEKEKAGGLQVLGWTTNTGCMCFVG